MRRQPDRAQVSGYACVSDSNGVVGRGSHMKWSLVIVLAALVVAPAAAQAEPSLSIEVVSNRADVISGGDALVAVKLPAGVKASTVRVTNGGHDITQAFALRPDGRSEGLVTGLSGGRNVLTATAPGTGAGSATIVTHPNGGP